MNDLEDERGIKGTVGQCCKGAQGVRICPLCRGEMHLGIGSQRYICQSCDHVIESETPAVIVAAPAVIEIPDSHWEEAPCDYDWRSLRGTWEATLRKSIAERPDPAARFTAWLAWKMSDVSHIAWFPGPRLVFIEQPYLGWAEAVERAIEKAEKNLRSAIAEDIANPERCR